MKTKTSWIFHKTYRNEITEKKLSLQSMNFMYYAVLSNQGEREHEVTSYLAFLA